MKNDKPIFRHEQKYLISSLEKDILRKRLEGFLKIDDYAKHGQYSIRSLYFDDFRNSAYEEKLSGISTRKKYRIRIYNYSDKTIKLECKHKQGRYIYKEVASLSKKEWEAILERRLEFLKDREEEICKNFYLECMTNQLRPKVMVDYERIPFVLSAGNVRITFDSDIREVMFFGDLFCKEAPNNRVLEQNKQIMEVKYDSCLPDLVKDLIVSSHVAETAASKYVMCCEKRIERTGMLLPLA